MFQTIYSIKFWTQNHVKPISYFNIDKTINLIAFCWTVILIKIILIKEFDVKPVEIICILKEIIYIVLLVLMCYIKFHFEMIRHVLRK